MKHTTSLNALLKPQSSANTNSADEVIIRRIGEVCIVLTRAPRPQLHPIVVLRG